MDSKSEIVEVEKAMIETEILFPDENKLSNEDISDINIKSEVKTEIEDFDFCEKEYVPGEVISEELSIIAQKRKNTGIKNHEFINQKKFKEEFVEFEELQNDPRADIQTKSGILKKEFKICKEEYLDEEIVEIELR
jgi:hypothetical protein